MSLGFEIAFGIMFGAFLIIEAVKTLFIIISVTGDEEPEIKPEVMRAMFS